MKRFRVYVLIFAILLFSSLCYAQDGKELVWGAWKLISIEILSFTGEVLGPDGWWGSNPTGLIIYDKSGYMSVQFMRDPKEIGGAQRYYAYFGTYDVNEKEGVIVHHIKGSLMMTEMGTDYSRRFKISGNRIMLTTERFKRLTFERVEREK